MEPDNDQLTLDPDIDVFDYISTFDTLWDEYAAKTDLKKMGLPEKLSHNLRLAFIAGATSAFDYLFENHALRAEDQKLAPIFDILVAIKVEGERAKLLRERESR